MTILRIIASNPGLSLLASVLIAGFVFAIRVAVGYGVGIPRHEPNVGDE